jgi:protein-L-isoaspartate(D-aspartate) O-methyltransferase
MVIPIGGPFFTQYLTLIEKDARGKIRTRQLLPVRFVPLTGGHG